MSVKIPEVKDILKTGMQFGHSSSKWNPKMKPYIYDAKNGIHVIDIVKSRELLEQAVNFLTEVAKTKEVIFVGSKRQATEIVLSQAQYAGTHFVIHRWPGGLFTNFDVVQRSLTRLHSLEKAFAEGVQGRTKYEIMQMKNEWARLDRLYSGVKQMQHLPGAMIVVDPRYERVAVREARNVGIPVIALTDSNCDPDMVDYLIPGNDDALGAIEMIVKVLAEAVRAGNGGKGIAHDLTDYTQVDVEIVRPLTLAEEAEVAPVEGQEAGAPMAAPQAARVRVSAKQLAASGVSAGGKGILEHVQDSAVKKRKRAAKE